MPEPVSLDQIKADLRLDPSETDEDLLLERLLAAARRAVELRTGQTIAGDTPTVSDDDMELARQAISLIAGTWYANREGVVTDVRTAPTELPLSVSWIIDTLRRWDDGSC